MNHPSDYMKNYEEHESSDSSNEAPLNQKIEQQSTHKKHLSLSLNNTGLFSMKNTRKCKKKTNNKIARNIKKQQKRTRAATDILILGNSYYSCKNVEQISQRFIEHKPKSIMMQDRAKKKQRNCITKIQKYIKTFLYRKKQISLDRIGQNQKKQLYQILLLEKHKSQPIMENLMKEILERLQKQAEILLRKYPSQQQQINQWKNIKLHQMFTVQSIFSKQKLEQTIFDWQKQLQLLKQQYFFPELRQQAQQLHEQIIKHIEQTQNKQKELDESIKWVINKLFEFIIQNQQIWNQVSQRMTLIQDRQQIQLISDRMFIQFQRQQIENQTCTRKKQEYIHIFNKAVFDLINEGQNKIQGLQINMQGLKSRLSLPGMCIFQENEEENFNQQQMLWVGDLIFEELVKEFLILFLDLL